MSRAKFHQRVEADQDVFTLAVERMRLIYDRFDHVAVLFSGGKDSTAVLNVALQVAREAGRTPLRVIFWDEEAIPMETEHYVRRVSQLPDVALEWYCLPVKHRNACSRSSPWWWPWAPEARDRWVRPMPPEAITELAGFPIDPPEARLDIPTAAGLLYPPRLGVCASLLGIRAQESLMRQRSLTRKRHENYLVHSGRVDLFQGNVWKAYPIYDWRTEDVWTAPAKFGWDYNAAYDALEMAGIPASKQRCSPAFGEEPLEKLWSYAHCFPDVWDRMVDRVPGVASAARYALTELYAYRGLPDKPPGATWGEFLRHYLTKFDAADRPKVARRIADEIKGHYRKTSDPILEHARHPLTGISWEHLLKLSMRGDFKNRKQAGAGMGADKVDRAWELYRAERAELEAAGRLREMQP